eukprot:Protomagalhaensia_wolfi_Nauph_80__5723@NODE_687_length_2114_cov_74_850602_g512_i0_p1_GENE_NODE_687_length_2114_cov_74_850602_g512_i0NODE_687_length_2114_cov_74_850602_g512_i0_p1_ORF_typecomplete_len369_score63_66bZIP_1/PF00170_21/0_041CUE/PF02845_16/0_054HAUS5/PF14817_6/0_046HAP1_N/PF04849_13/0_065ZapB/PF06005_12/0_14Vps39_2/PF10367_9/0_14JAKMIP_CC3/PF16034_5/0_21ATG16/PF08614_11/0_22HTH_Tnp_1/PF01527_20/0_42YabA/PF06156_13/0_34DUF4686/PF15742_5/0_54DUF3450/PF11932_8/0_99Mt_ATPsynt_B/PF05405_14/
MSAAPLISSSVFFQEDGYPLPKRFRRQEPTLESWRRPILESNSILLNDGSDGGYSSRLGPVSAGGSQEDSQIGDVSMMAGSSSAPSGGFRSGDAAVPMGRVIEEEGLDGFGPSNGASGPALCESASFLMNLTTLRRRFPSVSEGVLSSILESTGDRVAVAEGLVCQLLAVKPKAGRTSKRRRGDSADSFEMAEERTSGIGEMAVGPKQQEDLGVREESNHHHGVSIADMNEPSYCMEVKSMPPYVETAASQLLLRLRGARSESEAFSRLQPALLEVLQLSPELAQAKSLQRLLTKAIVRQADRLQEWQKKAAALEAENAELQRANRGLKDANNILSYYIKSQQQKQSSTTSPDNPDPFENGYRGPDVC